MKPIDVLGRFGRRVMLQSLAVLASSGKLPLVKTRREITSDIYTRAVLENRQLNLGLNERTLLNELREAGDILGYARLGNYWETRKEILLAERNM